MLLLDTAVGYMCTTDVSPRLVALSTVTHREIATVIGYGEEDKRDGVEAMQYILAVIPKNAEILPPAQEST
jgi:hypothetical protein